MNIAADIQRDREADVGDVEGDEDITEIMIRMEGEKV
jgi:hypothetical protein